MIENIKKAYELLYKPKGIKLSSGPSYRKETDFFDESGKKVSIGQVFYDCDFEFGGKYFPITFMLGDDINRKMRDAVIEHNIEVIL